MRDTCKQFTDQPNTERHTHNLAHRLETHTHTNTLIIIKLTDSKYSRYYFTKPCGTGIGVLMKGMATLPHRGGTSCRAGRANAPPDFDARGENMSLPSHFSMAYLPIVRMKISKN